MNPKNGKYRVVLVYLSFIPLALAAMWLVGGRTFFCTVTVSSNEPAELLRTKLADVSSSLKLVALENHRKSPTNVVFQEAGPVTSGQVGIIQSNVSLVKNGTVAAPAKSDHSVFCVDPNVVDMEAGFDSGQTLERHWYGKLDESTLVLRELDKNGRERLVQVSLDRFDFTTSAPDLVTSEVKTEVSYSFEITHSGVKRIYGRFLERSCEETHRQRLKWICKELEKK